MKKFFIKTLSIVYVALSIIALYWGYGCQENDYKAKTKLKRTIDSLDIANRFIIDSITVQNHNMLKVIYKDFEPAE